MGQPLAVLRGGSRKWLGVGDLDDKATLLFTLQRNQMTPLLQSVDKNSKNSKGDSLLRGVNS